MLQPQMDKTGFEPTASVQPVQCSTVELLALLKYYISVLCECTVITQSLYRITDFLEFLVWELFKDRQLDISFLYIHMG